MTRVRAGRRAARRPAAADPLTGLPPRSALEAYATADGVAVVVLDVDGFQDVNAALGFAAGDRLLVDLARRLAACGPAILTRLGADRFAAVVRADPSAGGWLAEATRLAEAARRAAAAPADPDSLAHVGMGVSVGVAAFPEHGRDAATLL